MHIPDHHIITHAPGVGVEEYDPRPTDRPTATVLGARVAEALAGGLAIATCFIGNGSPVSQSGSASDLRLRCLNFNKAEEQRERRATGADGGRIPASVCKTIIARLIINDSRSEEIEAVGPKSVGRDSCPTKLQYRLQSET